MSKLPIDKLMDEVEWQALEHPYVVVPMAGPGASSLPYVTHTGVLKLPIGNPPLELKVAQLSDGKRIIPDEELAKFFKAIGGKT